MKTINTILIICFLITLCPNSIQAQTEESIFNRGKETFLHKDQDIRLKSFLGRNVEDKIHLTWVISNLKTNGTFVIYRSMTGENYEIIGLTQSISAPSRKNAEYNFIDDNPINLGVSHYKIIFLGINNSYFMSPKITVDFLELDSKPAISIKTTN